MALIFIRDPAVRFDPPVPVDLQNGSLSISLSLDTLIAQTATAAAMASVAAVAAGTAASAAAAGVASTNSLLAGVQTLLGSLRPSITVTAAEFVSAFLPISSNGSIASNLDISEFNTVLGVSTSPANAGQPVAIAASGPVVNTNWSWTSGQAVFVGDKELSATPPSSGYSQQIGIAQDNITLLVSPQQAILL